MYKKYWSCMHDNPHHNQVYDVESWYKFMRDVYDFWPIAYYPYGMLDTNSGLKIEGLLDEQTITCDFEEIKRVVKLANSEGYPMFLGYEWQGDGTDGDHNVFFLNNDHYMEHPLKYVDLKNKFKSKDVIAIPHHIAYHLNDRGKNWLTHDEKFSPFAEIFSSHGCSESDLNAIPMMTHIHMGPRVSNTSYEVAMKKGIKIGCICSGDNHVFPGQFENGTMCVLAKGNSKSEIWDGLIHSRVYGVNFGRIDIDCTLDGKYIGETLSANKHSKLEVHVTGDNAIDRVEVLKDDILDSVYTHQGTWERKPLNKVLTFKFRIEFGWGPDMRIFQDIYKKDWEFKLQTNGTILSVEKCYNSIGTNIVKHTDNIFEANVVSYKSTGSGKWMGQSALKNEGYVFEIKADIDDLIHLMVDNKEYKIPVREILNGSQLFADLDSTRKLIQERFGEIHSYRNDTWWHNSYKFKIHQGIPCDGYECSFTKEIDTTEVKNVRIKVYQRNGAVAFVSPFFIERGKE